MRTGGAQWFTECVATFGLMLTILAGIRFERRAVPWRSGLHHLRLLVHGVHLVRQPGRHGGTVATDTFSGIRPTDLPGFIAAQLAGAVCGMAMTGWMLREPAGHVAPLKAEAQL